MGDQYLCLDQVKVDGNLPPPPPSKAGAPKPNIPPPPPPPPPKFSQPPPPPPTIPSPKSHREKSKSKNRIDNRSSSRKESSEGMTPDSAFEEEGHRPMVRFIIAITNGLFLIVLLLWTLTLLTGFHMVEISFINDLFMN
ncbi:hypothetical protein L5515_007263 [Caenorhabditis briggsae]|uniref:Uncharacterized protein n=1 Tax=Caenorhabditis briggsae TaxID=6238 RepID=A0AAE9A3X1_CAEBR|nr:hypothetical protein L3Y34_007415 [Caenorhabditis briggsae]UMM33996.1 hypothetical protein L5515_007263 [Caenorhabditis briggsae]